SAFRPAAYAHLRRGLPALPLVVFLLLAAGDASAQGAEGGSDSASAMLTPPAPPGDGAAATRIIKEVEASATTPRMGKVVAEPLKQARTALERAHGARMSNDVAHARMLDG